MSTLATAHILDKLREMEVVPWSRYQVEEHKLGVEASWRRTYVTLFGVFCTLTLLGVAGIILLPGLFALLGGILAAVCFAVSLVGITGLYDGYHLTSWREDTFPTFLGAVPGDIRDLADRLLVEFGDGRVLVESAQADPLLFVFEPLTAEESMVGITIEDKRVYVACWVDDQIIFNGATAVITP